MYERNLMWTLILLVSSYNSAAITSVVGYPSEKHCIAAGVQVSSLTSQLYTNKEIKFSCTKTIYR
jgi:hypothetical protein